MELCLIGLFLSTRDDRDAFASVGQAVIIIVTAILTVIYHLLLRNAFAPILKYISASSENGGDQEREPERGPEKELLLVSMLGSLRRLVSTCYGWMVPTKEVTREVQESVRELARNQLNIHDRRGYEHARYRSSIVWIPKDPLGISDDEIAYARDCFQDVRISNDFAELDL